MPVSNFTDIFDSDDLTPAEKARLKTIAAGIDRRGRLGLVAAAASDAGLNRMASPLIQSARDDRIQYAKRYEDEMDAAATRESTLYEAYKDAEDRAFRKQQQDDLNEYRRQSLGVQAAAQAAARDARSLAAEERAERTKRSEADRYRREYDTKRTGLRGATTAAEQILALTADPKLLDNPQAQTALVFSFGRMLDPTSVVREGEYKLFEQGRGVLDTLGNFPERAASGARLTPEQIRNMRQVAAGIAQRQGDIERQLTDRYYKLATQRGYDPYEVVGDYDPSSSVPSGQQGMGGVGVQPVAVYDINGKRVR
jgi:hypothetical protein